MIKDINSVLEKIVVGIREVMDVGVVGLSGGADSTLVATLLVEALGKDNVYGVHMPYGDTDYKEFNHRSNQIGTALGIKNLQVPIFHIVAALNGAIGDPLRYTEERLSEINKGNSRSRVRMCVLYGISHHLKDQLGDNRVRVVGTGNLSEDYIGYDTKGGDALGDLFPIGELFKSEVYQMLKHFMHYSPVNFHEVINTKPSAGLWEGQTDEEELGYTYNEMEPHVKYLRAHDGFRPEQPKDLELLRMVRQRHLANKHKHEAPPVIELRQYCD